ncbi:MAG: alpha/beta hydrolase [Mycobacterium sp.]|uniref:alpha/beta fold hydrolase n=1 Tax=Mycolicibacterium sp. TaxID=2320850 RepID=UPI0025F1D8B6|nr:alpha/beta hydrolase [Mycolicibacterium sp.]
MSGDHGPWLVLAHGLGGAPSVWDPFVANFQTDYRVVTFAQSGSVDADPSCFSPTRHSSTLGFADDLSLLCGEMGVQDAVFVGHSVGGNAGVLAAVGNPGLFSRLVLINSSPCYVDDPEGYRGGFSRDEIETLLESITADYDAWAGGFGPLVMSNSERPEYANEFVRGLRRLDPEVAAIAFRAAFTGDFRAIFPRVDVPTLVLQSQSDPAVPMDVARWVASRIPSARLVELPTTGHFPHLIDPDGVIEVIEPFVAGSA